MRLSCVTVYKYRNNRWERCVYDRANIRRIRALGTKRGEREEGDTLTVRIFSEDAWEIEPGDKITEGIAPDKMPENTLTVIEVADNRILKNSHIRVSAS
ncbi:MAG: hypothetical protein Q4B31_02915 [Clostridia bacterium]|nr:hypothetical protein [Clostridia bacterium]